LVAVGAGVLLVQLRATPDAAPPPVVATAPPATVPPSTSPPETLPPVPLSRPPAAAALAVPRLTSSPPRPTPSQRPARLPPPTFAAVPTPTATPLPTPPPTTAPPAEPGLLQLAVRPWAEVSVDGRVIGTTPLDRLSLAPGVHNVTLRHPGYQPLSRTVTVRTGETAKLVVDLAREGVPRQN
ncbi:MAG TPA: PEGA domain-containing protein, partial [Vicinamibacteria bacterium]|nr:PEGA domain-containing protein [Vicinamibacteria bacterium]